MRRSFAGSSIADPVRNVHDLLRHVWRAKGSCRAGSTGCTSDPHVRPARPPGVATATVREARRRRQRSNAAMSQRQAAARVPTIASNTGCTSVGELLITRRMSAVAVWWLKRLLGLVEQPRVLQRHADVGGDRGQQPLVVGVVRAFGLRALHADHAQARAAHAESARPGTRAPAGRRPWRPARGRCRSASLLMISGLPDWMILLVRPSPYLSGL